MTLAEDLVAIQAVLTRCILPALLILGVIGNLFNIIVFSQKHLRVNSCSVYCISTSMFNFLVMCFGIIPIISTSYSSYDHASYSVSYCKFRSYFVHVLFMLSRSSLALASLDRFMLCAPAARIRALNCHRTAISLLFFVSLVWFVAPIHMLVYTNIQMPGRRCSGSGDYLFFYELYAAAATAMPLLLMVIFSTLAIRDLKLARSRVRPQSFLTALSNSRMIRIKRRDAQLVGIVVSEVIVYCVSTILFPVYSIYVAATATVSKDADRIAVEGFAHYIALSFLLYLNAALIFYVHLLASKASRAECRKLVLGVTNTKILASRAPH